MPLTQSLSFQTSLRLPLLLGIAHGLADLASGFLLGVLPHHVAVNQAIWLILVYNVLAFGAQPLLGWLTDRLGRPRLAVWVGLVALAIGLGSISQSLVVAIAFAGIGSAAFHVGGGALAYWATPQQSIGAGLFAAPGVVGLAIGGILGFSGWAIAPVLVGLLLGMAVVIARSNLPLLPYAAFSPSPPLSSQLTSLPLDDPLDFLLLLIGAIALGSAVWTGLQLWLLDQTPLLIGMAIAAAIGKVVGGVLSSRWGWHWWTTAALVSATLLLLRGAHPLTLIPAVALLQSTVPITLTATIRLMPNRPATAAGLTLGLAILLGGIPVLAGVRLFPQGLAIAVLFLVAMAIALWGSLRLFATPVAGSSVSVGADVKDG